MAKTLIKTAVALLVVHGMFQLGNAYWDFYRYEDALQQIALFGERRQDRQLCEDALSTAASYSLPIGAADLTVFRGMNPPYNCETGAAPPAGDRPTRAGEIGFIGGYVENVRLLPGYTKPWEFQLRVAVRATP